jgi:hypothetical protein
MRRARASIHSRPTGSHPRPVPALRVTKVVKVRRVGNSYVISTPREFEARGYAPGSSVLVEELPDGDLRIMSTEKVRERIQDIGGRLITEHGEALEVLASHDPDAPRR